MGKATAHVWSRRRWTATLAEDVPAGPEGQPAHLAGAEIVVSASVFVEGVGGISFSVPRPSALLRESAEVHVRRAVRLRAQSLKQTRRIRWSHPGMELSFSNETLVMDFFREAMAGVVCAHAALDNLANELLPTDFTFTDPKGRARSRDDLEAQSGLELRLSRVAAAATGRENLRAADPTLWERLMALKDLRDDIAHAKADQAFSVSDPNSALFARLILAPLESMIDDIDAAADHYLGTDEAP